MSFYKFANYILLLVLVHTLCLNLIFFLFSRLCGKNTECIEIVIENFVIGNSKEMCHDVITSRLLINVIHLCDQCGLSINKNESLFYVLSVIEFFVNRTCAYCNKAIE